MTIKMTPLRESWNGFLGNYSASCENCNRHIDTQVDAFFVIQRAIIYEKRRCMVKIYLCSIKCSYDLLDKKGITLENLLLTYAPSVAEIKRGRKAFSDLK